MKTYEQRYAERWAKILPMLKRRLKALRACEIRASWLALILPLLLNSCAWGEQFFRTHRVSGTVFVERGDNKAGLTVTTEPTGKSVVRSAK